MDQPKEPGWYDDPELVGTRRYWDGSEWTDHRLEKDTRVPAGDSPDEGQGLADESAAEEKKKGAGMGCLLLIGVVVIWSFVSSLGGDDDGSDDDGGGEWGARSVCEEFVEKRLKAPSTADFSDTSAVDLGGGEWRVTGSVDSENSFGAKIRNTYTCTVEHVSGENWRLVNIAGLAN